jgi:hypothetical protein
MEYYDEIEHELYVYDSQDDDNNGDNQLSPEDWQDLNSQELLNLWMSIVEYHENWYLPLNKTFNQFCEFVYFGVCGEVTTTTPEIQAIKNHPWIKDLDWEEFFI